MKGKGVLLVLLGIIVGVGVTIGISKREAFETYRQSKVEDGKVLDSSNQSRDTSSLTDKTSNVNVSNLNNSKESNNKTLSDNKKEAKENSATKGTSDKNAELSKDNVTVGKEFLGLKVKEMDVSEENLNRVSFNGEITLSGKIVYSEYMGDGEGYFFEVNETDIKKLPTLSKIKNANNNIVLTNFEEVDKIFKKETRDTTIIIKNYTLANAQITTRADFIKEVKR